jgi:hypothetical protein
MSRPYVPSNARFVERFLVYVGILGGDSCWPWLGHYQNGRPVMRLPKNRCSNPRVFVWALFGKGPIRLDQHPRCRTGNGACCRPDHLELHAPGRPPRVP